MDLSDIEIILLIAAFVVMVDYLIHKPRQRDIRPFDPRKEIGWDGMGIDAGVLSTAIDQVRHDYRAARRTSSRTDAHRKEEAVALARKAAGRMSYFQEREARERIYEEKGS